MSTVHLNRSEIITLMWYIWYIFHWVDFIKPRNYCGIFTLNRFFVPVVLWQSDEVRVEWRLRWTFCFRVLSTTNMIRLFQTKNASKDGADSAATKRTCAAQLRINKDVNELELPPGCHIEFPGLCHSPIEWMSDIYEMYFFLTNIYTYILEIHLHCNLVLIVLCGLVSDKNDFLNFRLSIAPDEGFYKVSLRSFRWHVGRRESVVHWGFMLAYMLMVTRSETRFQF